MLINVIIFVPKILIEHRYEGSVMGVLIAIPIGIGMNYLYSHTLNKFPGKGLPEILADSKHRWLVNLHLGSIQILWFSAGLITLLNFTDILSRFINPEMPKLLMITI
ncbi:hypothetical protein [Neobacillus bataviensis]|uniref:hypothetical protein n=1 Tax=Neobacillus bataviensis TaxID=220685 RepID=UPI001CBD5774|nr:hypothetical protein [Neobacillus bataviensis]